MTKQKLFSTLSRLGTFFIIALMLGYFISFNNRGDVIVHKVDVPEDFSSQFSAVTLPNRAEPPPDISFLDPQGKERFWRDFKGEFLLVNFWATWCAPCVVELPSLDRLRQDLKGKGLNVIAISLDKQREHKEIISFLENRSIGDFAAYYDHSGMMERQLRLRGIPTSYLLDRSGNILTIFEGDADWHSPPAIAYFEEILTQ